MILRLGLLALLLGLSCPHAWAQGDSLRDDGRRVPAAEGSLEAEYAAQLGDTLGLDPQAVERLEQPAENRPFAGQAVHGKGNRIRFRGLTVARLKFPDPAVAAAFASTQVAKVDAQDPTVVTVAQGKGATPEVVAQAERQAKGLSFSDDLALLLGREEKDRGPHVVAAKIPANRPGFVGVDIRFAAGLRVRRIGFEAAETARDALELGVDPRTSRRRIADLRGTQLLVLEGNILDDATYAKRALLAAWTGWVQAPRRRVAIAVCAPSPSGKPNFVAFTRQNGRLYQAGARPLRIARDRTRRGKADGRNKALAWRFMDPESRNHLVFWSRDTFGGAVARPKNMFVAINPDKATCKAERAYFAALLRALDYRLPPKKTDAMTELLAPQGN